MIEEGKSYKFILTNGYYYYGKVVAINDQEVSIIDIKNEPVTFKNSFIEFHKEIKGVINND